MNIELTAEQAAVVTDKTVREVTEFAVGLINFHLDEARQQAERESLDLNKARLEVLLSDSVSLTKIDNKLAILKEAAGRALEIAKTEEV